MKPKILHIIPTLGPGGAERQLIELAIATKNSGIDVEILYFSNPNFFESRLKYLEIPFHSLNLLNHTNWISAAIDIKKFIKEINPDVIHSWLFDAIFSLRIAKILLLKDFPSVISIQAPDYDPIVIQQANWPKWKMNIKHFLDMWSAKFFNETFIPCSDYLASYLNEKLNISPSQIRRIYNACDFSKFNPKPDSRKLIRKELNIPENDIVITSVARLDPQKGTDILIDAFFDFHLKHPNSHLILIGSGSLKPVFEMHIAKLALEKKVHLVGNKPDIENWLSASDIFAFPSRFEGFGIALIEAMAMGLPCISTNTGPIPEIIKPNINGILIPVNDKVALALELDRLANDNSLKIQLGKQAKIDSIKNFDLNHSIFSQWKKTYQQTAQTDLI